MKRRGPTSLEEHKKQLASDPEYRRKRAEKLALVEKLAAECAKDEAALVREIRESGYDVGSVWDLVNNAPHPFLERRFVGPYPAAYEILTRHLRMPHHPRTREGIARALTVRDGPDGLPNALLAEFTKESDQHVRWALSNALVYMTPKSELAKIPEVLAAHERGVVL